MVDKFDYSSNYLSNDYNVNATDEEKAIYNKYSFYNTSELSDYTKAYLNSRIIGTRPELSDYTKAYLDSLTSSSSDVKPELSNLTKEYLSSNTPEKGGNDN